MKPYKIKFKVKISYGGVYSYADAHITVMANNEIEASTNLYKSAEFSISGISSVKEVKL